MQQFEQQLISNLQQIQPPDQNAMQLCRRRWDSIAKPLHSLGLLEDAIATIASAQGCPQVRLDKKCVAVFCADNGVVAQGVTQSQQDVTAIVTENFCSGRWIPAPVLLCECADGKKLFEPLQPVPYTEGRQMICSNSNNN